MCVCVHVPYSSHQTVVAVAVAGAINILCFLQFSKEQKKQAVQKMYALLLSRHHQNEAHPNDFFLKIE